MGRYSSVQTYADSNANMRSVPYEQATGSAAPKGGVVKPEKVVNPYGSTAGAGSGEFHVYRHARARELERWKQLNQEEKDKLLDEEYATTLEKNKQEEDSRTAKRRKKRQRQKEAKLRKKNLKLSGVGATKSSTAEDVDEEEFTYEPVVHKEETDKDQNEETTKMPAVSEETGNNLPYANDGSFLEQMKKRLREEESNQEDDTAEESPKKKAKVGDEE